MDKMCFLFGSSTTPHYILPDLETAVEAQYLNYGIRYFLVGCRGNFDQIAATAVKTLKQKYNDVCLDLLIPYHPAERPVQLTGGFDGTFYPEGMETVPKRVAIMQANRLAIAAADVVVCYVNGVGNSRKMLDFAQSQERRRNLMIINLAET